MPQGCLKTKTKLPSSVKLKNKSIRKPKDIQKKNRPQGRRNKESIDKLNKAVTQAINCKNEGDITKRAAVAGTTFNLVKNPDAEKKPK